MIGHCLVLFCCLLLLASSSYGGHIRQIRENDPEQENNKLDAPAVGLNSKELQHCYSSEPCLFVMTKRNPLDNSVESKYLPSWCRCRDTEDCIYSTFDKRKKAAIHQCVPKEQPIILTSKRFVNQRRIVQ